MAFFMKDRKEVNPLAVGAVGLVIGVAGAATALAMTNPKTRKMVMDKVNDVKNRTNQGIKYVLGRVEDVKEKMNKK